MKSGQKKKVWTAEERLAHIEAFKVSGKSLSEYGKEHGVNEQTLYNWVSGRNLKTTVKKVAQKKAQVDDLRAQVLATMTAFLPTAPYTAYKCRDCGETVEERWERTKKEGLMPIFYGVLAVTGVNVAAAVAHVVAWIWG